jgi:hypothetical protein
VGRRNLSRLALALAAAALLAQSAAGASSFRVIATGRTEGSGDSLHAYVATSASRAWVSRLSARDRARMAGVDFAHSEVGAVFLDGRICAYDTAITAFMRVRGTVRVNVAFTRPRVGVATCVRQDTPYIVFTFSRTSTPATSIEAAAVARA